MITDTGAGATTSSLGNSPRRTTEANVAIKLSEVRLSQSNSADASIFIKLVADPKMQEPTTNSSFGGENYKT